MNVVYDILTVVLIAGTSFLLGSVFEQKIASKWPKRGESPKPDFARARYLGVDVIIHPSAGSDGAPVVQIDTSEDLEGSIGSPGPKIRVLINDDDTYVGVPYEPIDEVA